MTKSREEVAAENAISTHTPLAGRDKISDAEAQTIAISTHTPLAGRDQGCGSWKTWEWEFLLTRPSRDVTWQ